MKKILLLFFLPIIGFGQKTYVPDNLFEYCLEGYQDILRLVENYVSKN